MEKIASVIRYELISAVWRKSFLFTLVLVPLVSFVVVLVPLMSTEEPVNDQTISEFLIPQREYSIEGFVDRAGIINEIPTGMDEYLRFFNTSIEADTALQKGEIDSYYIVEEQYLDTGRLIYVDSEFNPLTGISPSYVFRLLISYNLLEGDSFLAQRVVAPMVVEEMILSDTVRPDPDSLLSMVIPYGITFLLYVVILGSSTLLLNSVNLERQNQTLEILLTSVRPVHLLAGKMLSLGLVGLMQTVIWGGSAMLLVKILGSRVEFEASLQSLGPAYFIWGIVFFLSGYFLYASILAGVGALVKNLRESSHITLLIISPMVIPLMFIGILLQKPDGIIAMFLSFFPFTSPMTMMARISITSVPVWQPFTAVVILLLTILFFIRGLANIFRVNYLLSGDTFRVSAYLKAFFGR